ncbi:MAG: FCD domain-containing protein [Streptosporangiales bacterium]|nr:FCD domain-containing protein [Streptosporangiales bacterium]
MAVPREIVGTAGLGRRPQLSDEVATYIRELIMSGQVRQGEFLRLEKVASDLGISATPVREALLSLRGEGFVHLEPRRGFVVASLSRQDVEDLFFVQASIAAELAARSAERISPGDLDELEGLQEGMAKAAEGNDVDAIEDHNHRFHRVLNVAADSPKLTWMLGTVVRYAPRRFYGTIQGWIEASLEDHRIILAALRAKDADAARKAMHEHIVHAGDLLVSHLEDQGFWRKAS